MVKTTGSLFLTTSKLKIMFINVYVINAYIHSCSLKTNSNDEEVKRDDITCMYIAVFV